MSFVEYARKHLNEIPYPIGKFLSLVPYSLRPGVGRVYRNRRQDIDRVEALSVPERKSYVFERVKTIAVFAYRNIPFYTDLYRSCGVNPEKFSSFDDLKNIPIITKDDLQSVSLEYRSHPVAGQSLVNTGGSSGKPLDLHICPDNVGHEWAHIHHIWQRLGFSPRDVRIVFAGRSDVTNGVQYDSFRHQFSVDIYAGWEEVANKLMAVYRHTSPRYLHGYPSAIFDFVLWARDVGHPICDILVKYIDGIFLSSEFPSPQLRSDVERVLSCPSVSWYGHTERAVLAYERSEHERYYPFLSYGYAEAAETDMGLSLISTSYYNFASPIIRYDTGDLIRPAVVDGIMESFSVSLGRNGDYIIDRKGNKVFLTALVFGRHHEIFRFSKSVQVYQKESGLATFFVVLRADFIDSKAVDGLFDLRNVDIDFSVKIVDFPLRTVSGKVPLLVRDYPLD